MDRTTRSAATWATAVALPLTALVAALAFFAVRPDDADGSGRGAADPTPSATAPVPQSTAPVPMPAPALSERGAVVCRALLSQLPRTLRELAQRPVTAGPEQNAAYGDPAVTVACGVPAASFPPTDDVWVFGRVCWHTVSTADATVLTSVDREMPVEVTVPRAYDSAAQWTVPLAESIIATVPSLKQFPSGCKR
jgi:hypothetical protein